MFIITSENIRVAEHIIYRDTSDIGGFTRKAAGQTGTKSKIHRKLCDQRGTIVEKCLTVGINKPEVMEMSLPGGDIGAPPGLLEDRE